MLHIVLYEPEIPQNTGNIMRSCAGTGAKLHLIEPLGFLMDEKHLRRAAMDYLEFVDYEIYPNYEDFLEKNKPEHLFMLSRHGRKNHAQMDVTDISQDYYFMFGKESAGIPKQIIKDNIDNAFRIPMNEHVRSFNLSNCAAIVLFEALRQQSFPGLSEVEPEVFKGKEWIMSEE